MGVDILAFTNPITAAASVGNMFKQNMDASRDMAKAQENLRDQQSKQLADQAAASAALAAKQATGGRFFGRENTILDNTATGLGFGSGRGAANTGYGRGQLTGG